MSAAHDYAECLRVRLPRTLQEQREAAGMSRYALEKKCGVSREMIGCIENGDSIPTLHLGARLPFLSTLNSQPSTLPAPMPFDPSKPAANSTNSSAEMRGQLTSLNADIQQRATQADLANAIAAAIAGTSNNSNDVDTLSQGASGGYDPGRYRRCWIRSMS